MAAVLHASAWERAGDLPRAQALLVLPVVALLVGGWGLRVVRNARRSSYIAEHGEPGSGRILAIERTGTTINDLPLMRIRVEVTLPGRSPLRASTTRLMEPHVTSAMLGTEAGVLWHSSYPEEVVLEE